MSTALTITPFPKPKSLVQTRAPLVYANDNCYLHLACDPRGKVTDIDNNAIAGGTDDRTYNYDNLGRLTSATGSWGSSSYKYDVLGALSDSEEVVLGCNIMEKQVWARTIEMTYNAVNRLVSHEDIDAGGYPISGTKRILSYDTHGNVTWPWGTMLIQSGYANTDVYIWSPHGYRMYTVFFAKRRTITTVR